MDILQNEWNPALCRYDRIIISVQSLLDDPNPDNFLNEEAAKLLKEDKKQYEITVKNYTSLFANFLIFENDLQKLNIKIKTIDKKKDCKKCFIKSSLLILFSHYTTFLILQNHFLFIQFKFDKL